VGGRMSDVYDELTELQRRLAQRKIELRRHWSEENKFTIPDEKIIEQDYIVKQLEHAIYYIKNIKKRI